MNKTKTFKGVWIPIEIYLDKRLSPLHKLLLSEIAAFTQMGTTYHKSNSTIADEMSVSEVTVTRAVSKLKEYDLIKVTHEQGRTRHIKSTMQYSHNDDAPNQIDDSPSKHLTRQSSQIDDKRIQKKKTTKNTTKFIVPAINEVVSYFLEQGSSESEAHKYFDYYTANGWVQGRSNKKLKDWNASVRNWLRNQSQFAKKNDGFNKDNYNADRLKRFIAQGR